MFYIKYTNYIYINLFQTGNKIMHIQKLKFFDPCVTDIIYNEKNENQNLWLKTFLNYVYSY